MEIDIELIEDKSAGVRRLKPVEAHATDGSTAEEMADGCEVYTLTENGQAVGAVAVRTVGNVATITAAASQGIVTYSHLALLEAQLRARGVRAVGLFTRRPGLVRRMIGQGYRLVEAELIKEI